MVELGLGAVQLGLPYGNRAHLPPIPEIEAFSILQTAWEAGIRIVDTAPAYGESEARLGKYMSTHGHKFRVMTKIPPCAQDVWTDMEKFQNHVNESIESSKIRLNVASFDTIFLHQSNPEFVTSAPVRRAVEVITSSGIAKDVGVSVYTQTEAKSALKVTGITALQAPINIIDDRFVDPCLQSGADGGKIKIIARSVFLQGVLFPEAPIPQVSKSRELLALREMLSSCLGSTVSLDKAALQHVLKNCSEFVDVVLIGCASQSDLAHNINLHSEITRSPANIEGVDLEKAKSFAREHGLYNPSQW